MSINLEHPDYIDLKNRLREDPKDFVAIIGSERLKKGTVVLAQTLIDSLRWETRGC